MQKRGLLVFGLFLISFVSAYNGNPFSFQNFFDSLDPSNAILGSVFILSFALIFLGLINISKFGKNRGIAAIISFAISFLIVYGVHKSGIDYDGFYYDLFYNIGLSEGVASSFISVVLLIGAFFVIWKFGFAALLIVFGLLLMGAGLFGFFYEQFAAVILGFILVVVGLFIKKKTKNK